MNDATIHYSDRDALNLLIRGMEDADIEPCGRICFEAFRSISDKHQFLSNFLSVDGATNRVRAFFRHPSVCGLVATVGGVIVGCNFLIKLDDIFAIGPIVVDPATQARRIGRRLMEAALEQAQGARGVRLVQESFNMQSLALYASLGFEARDALVLLSGTPRSNPAADYEVRRMVESDLPGCEHLHFTVHGFRRTNELRERLATGSPIVAIRDGQITAYVAVPTVWMGSHGVAEHEEAMKALLLGAARIEVKALSVLMPVRFGALFQWCLAEGFRATKPMTLMSIGEFKQTERVYFPSVSY